MIRRTVIAFWLFPVVLGASYLARAEGGPATTVIIVRHAEKDTAKVDPALTAAGLVRAGELARLLSASAVDAVISSDRRRTLETAAPAARDHGLRIDTVTRKGTVEEYVQRIVARIAATDTGKSVLVVSHSDIIPALVKALGVSNPVEIPDTVYDDLFIVTRQPGGRATLLHLKYGAPAP